MKLEEVAEYFNENFNKPAKYYNENFQMECRKTFVTKPVVHTLSQNIKVSPAQQDHFPFTLTLKKSTFCTGEDSASLVKRANN